jgi:hypothetical protein
VNDGDLVRRISDALHCAWQGRAIAMDAEQLSQHIAWEIVRLRAEGREIYIEDEAKTGETWLASALLVAASKGLLREIADLVDGGDVPAKPDKYRIIQAYAEVHSREERPPVINELLKELGIDKPKRTRDNMREWLKVNNRERMIRKTLTEFRLPLSTGKRGRPLR